MAGWVPRRLIAGYTLYIPDWKACQLALVTFRVPERLRKQMRKLRSVNWSGLLRQAIEERIELEQRNVMKDWDRVRAGSRKADAIRHEIERRYGYVDFNSAETIMYWREHRFGATSRTPL